MADEIFLKIFSDILGVKLWCWCQLPPMARQVLSLQEIAERYIKPNHQLLTNDDLSTFKNKSTEINFDSISSDEETPFVGSEDYISKKSQQEEYGSNDYDNICLERLQQENTEFTDFTQNLFWSNETSEFDYVDPYDNFYWDTDDSILDDDFSDHHCYCTTCQWERKMQSSIPDLDHTDGIFPTNGRYSVSHFLYDDYTGDYDDNDEIDEETDSIGREDSDKDSDDSTITNSESSTDTEVEPVESDSSVSLVSSMASFSSEEKASVKHTVDHQSEATGEIRNEKQDVIFQYTIYIFIFMIYINRLFKFCFNKGY